ncbi:MAG: DUF2500 domain-containing protein [Oscillospiraceae bacterium]|nr:DUF2500 domain-containing protein [Oscillospiraceae bacterium]
MNGDFLITIVPIFVGMAAVLLLAVIVVRCVLGMRKWKASLSSPLQCWEAVVAEKRAAQKARHKLSSSSPASFDTELETQYEIDFSLADGSVRTFSVPETIFALLSEGDTGRLTVQQERFVKFER